MRKKWDWGDRKKWIGLRRGYFKEKGDRIQNESKGNNKRGKNTVDT